ncbi:hypothetical protein BDW22DRAFT_1355977 [Trametopsis cervina]|nr:hypothetical protein BDW22DRAFT_1355977 [Trametopsis cervina]
MCARPLLRRAFHRNDENHAHRARESYRRASCRARGTERVKTSRIASAQNAHTRCGVDPSATVRAQVRARHDGEGPSLSWPS